MRIKQHYTRDTIPERGVSKPYYPPKGRSQESRNGLRPSVKKV